MLKKKLKQNNVVINDDDNDRNAKLIKAFI